MSARKRFSQANYSRLEFDAETEAHLFDYSVRNRLGIANRESGDEPKVEDFRFHVTLVYSGVTHPSFHDGSFDIEPFRLLPKRFQIFGAAEPRLVLEFRLDERLQGLFQHYREAFGHQPDFEPFRPHVSIKGTKGADDSLALGLDMPDFPMRACRIVHEVR